MSGSVFSELSDDVVLNILHKLDEDPRNWARIACVSTKLSSLIRNICCKTKCLQLIRAVVSDLIPYGGASAGEPPGGWAALYKLTVCCPGLLHSGVLLENSGEDYRDNELLELHRSGKVNCSSRNIDRESTVSSEPNCDWQLYDDKLIDATCIDVESTSKEPAELVVNKPGFGEIETVNPNFSKRRKICRSLRSHMASGIWNLSREQGNKLLGSRFKGDCLYICDWPGCLHIEEKRNYMLFRGIFKNFTESRVWRTIKDGNRSKIGFNCVYCSSNQIWDMHSSFVLRRYFGYHEDGDQVVRAYVCENGHVSGAWTDWSLYN